MRKLVEIIVCAAVPFAAGAQRPGAGAIGIAMTAQSVYDSIQHIRSAADPLWRAGDRRGLALLDSALEYIDKEPAQDLALSNPYLRSRRSNVWFDIMQAKALTNDTSGALHALLRAEQDGGSRSYLVSLERDSALAALLRSSPEYSRIQALWRSDLRLWNDSAFQTFDGGSLSEDQRIAGLSQIWSQVKFSVPDFELTPGLDWDSLYLAYLPRVRSAPGTFAYYRILEQFVASLHDGHTNVYFPDSLLGKRYARPPIRTARIEGRTIVTAVLSPAMDSLAIHVGDEIVAIDGEGTDDYASQRVAPYQSSSTSQDLDVRAYTYQLLAGDSAAPVRITLRTAGGQTRTVSVNRSGYGKLKSVVRTFDTTLAGNLGYLRVDGFDADTLKSYLRKAMERLKNTAGLIIDVRRNGGGSSGYGWQLLSYLAADPSLESSERYRSYVALEAARGLSPAVFIVPPDTIFPDKTFHYGNPVVVLIGPATFSSAEDFASAFKTMRRGKIIGEASGGSTGQPLFFRLPGGGSARVRTKHDFYPDGKEFVGIGVLPDITAHPTIAGVRDQRDDMLEAAISSIRAELVVK
jgi:carboxyl-terminal processing protease